MICGAECKYKNARVYGYYDRNGIFRCFGPVQDYSFDICDFTDMQRTHCSLSSNFNGYVMSRVSSTGCHLESGRSGKYYWQQNLLVDMLKYCRDLKDFVPFHTINSGLIENAINMTLSALPKKLIEFRYCKGASVESICKVLDMSEGTYYDIRNEAYLTLYTYLRKYN